MRPLKGKHIVVGVTAGIAAYKAVELVSRLYKAGAEVKVVMTRNATKFVSPLVFGEISKHKVAVIYPIIGHNGPCICMSSYE